LTEAVWHDVECAAYEADLPLWEALADGAGGPVLDLGCGTGRVALHLARRGHRVLGLDRDADLIAVLRERAGELPAEAEVADARIFDVGASFDLALAPMQLLQLFGGASERLACLGSVKSHLRPGGTFACAIVESMVGGTNRRDDGSLDPGALPDTREVKGSVYSSLPVEAAVGDDEIVVRRLRQVVSPSGEMSERESVVRLGALTADTLEGEGRAAGLRPRERRPIPPTLAHVGSTVVVLEREES
jgi:SAM-dependent methyltransferase